MGSLVVDWMRELDDVEGTAAAQRAQEDEAHFLRVRFLPAAMQTCQGGAVSLREFWYDGWHVHAGADPAEI